MPEARRCPGTVELLMVREPIARLGSFGRELTRWGLLPEPARHRVGPLCDGLRRRECQVAIPSPPAPCPLPCGLG